MRNPLLPKGPQSVADFLAVIESWEITGVRVCEKTNLASLGPKNPCCAYPQVAPHFQALSQSHGASSGPHLRLQKSCLTGQLLDTYSHRSPRHTEFKSTCDHAKVSQMMTLGYG